MDIVDGLVHHVLDIRCAQLHQGRHLPKYWDRRVLLSHPRPLVLPLHDVRDQIPDVKRRFGMHRFTVDSQNSGQRFPIVVAVQPVPSQDPILIGHAANHHFGLAFGDHDQDFVQLLREFVEPHAIRPVDIDTASRHLLRHRLNHLQVTQESGALRAQGHREVEVPILEILLTLRKLRHSRKSFNETFLVPPPSPAPRVRSKTVRKSNVNWSSVIMTAMATAEEKDKNATLLRYHERHTLLFS